MQNRNGLVAQFCLTHATGTAERDAALVLAVDLEDLNFERPPLDTSDFGDVRKRLVRPTSRQRPLEADAVATGTRPFGLVT